jgi:hypothetical protein
MPITEAHMRHLLLVAMQEYLHSFVIIYISFTVLNTTERKEKRAQNQSMKRCRSILRRVSLCAPTIATKACSISVSNPSE